MTAFLHSAPLAERHEADVREPPWYSPREHARQLCMTEADLVEMDEGFASARLRPDWPALLAALWTLGPTVAQTCNEHAVLETAGIYPRSPGDTGTALFSAGRFDLRLFVARFAHVWAVKDCGRTSLQVFGRNGAAIHKVNLTSASNRAGWTQLLEAHAAPDLPPQTILSSAVLVCPFTDDRLVVTRIQAQDVAERRARPVVQDALRTVLQAAADTRLAVEMTVGNPGCTHSCRGAVATLGVTPPWLQVSGPHASLRVRESAIAEAWVVARQTEYGMVHALEAFDRRGAMIVALSGCHDAELAEERLWRAILNALPRPASRLPARQFAPA